MMPSRKCRASSASASSARWGWALLNPRTHVTGGTTEQQGLVLSLLEKWLKRLQLEHWALHVLIAKHHELSTDADATCSPHLDLHTAVIKIGQPEQQDQEFRKHWPYDLEQLLVHELLHLHFDLFMPEDKKDPGHSHCEQVIEAISWSLIWSDRQTYPPKSLTVSAGKVS